MNLLLALDTQSHFKAYHVKAALVKFARWNATYSMVKESGISLDA